MLGIGVRGKRRSRWLRTKAFLLFDSGWVGRDFPVTITGFGWGTGRGFEQIHKAYGKRFGRLGLSGGRGGGGEGEGDGKGGKG